MKFLNIIIFSIFSIGLLFSISKVSYSFELIAILIKNFLYFLVFNEIIILYHLSFSIFPKIILFSIS